MEDEFVGMLLWDVWDMPNLLVLFPRPRAASPFKFTFRMVITRSELPGRVCSCKLFATEGRENKIPHGSVRQYYANSMPYLVQIWHAALFSVST